MSIQMPILMRHCDNGRVIINGQLGARLLGYEKGQGSGIESRELRIEHQEARKNELLAEKNIY